MPVPTRVQPEKNIWVAAGDGDLERVRELIEHHSYGPNVPDENTYTPMHAAASYGQLHILEYLISKDGDVNITDEDGDTPLYAVENIETARFLVEHGAVVNRINAEGISPVTALEEDFLEVSHYLQSVLSSAASNAPPSSLTTSPSTPPLPSQHAQNQASEILTTNLIEQAQDIMRRAEVEGRDPEEELREVVGRAVLEGVGIGFGMSLDTGREDGDMSGDGGGKKPRLDG
ncbi:ankyrin repeat-containing domain protein [Abortiporus biennis]|nr:ankyrin repeat-containing domain protein [Abortiporus biennis]